MLAFDYFDFQGRQRPDAEFACCHERRITYGQAQGYTNQVANALLDCGLEPGDRCAFLMKNSLESVLLFLGAFKAGVVPAPINFRLRPCEWVRICQDSEAKLLLADAPFTAEIDTTSDQLASVRGFVRLGQSQSNWDDLRSWIDGRSRDKPNVRPFDNHDLLQMYTSGTTGAPRHVVLTHRAVVAGIAQLRHVCHYSVGDRFHLVMPLCHAAGVIAMLHAVSWGAPLLIESTFSPVETVNILDRRGVTVSMMVPTMIQACLNDVRDISSRRFDDLNLIIYGASPIDERTIRRAMEVFRCDFAQRYGTTETLSLTWLGPRDHRLALEERPELLQSAGRPLAETSIQVVDPEGRPLPSGEKGEIIAFGPQLVDRVWTSDDSSTLELNGQRWIRTGDIGFIDRDGYVYIRARVNDLIVSGGENIFPQEIEVVINRHSDVADCAVIGVPDLKWGESVKAIVVLRAGARLTEAQLIDFCRSHLAGFKIPLAVDFVSTIPRNPAGKALRRMLRDR